MATTNAELIFTEQMELLRAGKIGTTGRKIAVKDSAGKLSIIEEPEPIHTFAYWKACGFSVKKGEKAVTRLTIWKYAADKKSQDKTMAAMEEVQPEGGHCFMKESCFFAASQVEPTKARENRKAKKAS